MHARDVARLSGTLRLYDSPGIQKWYLVRYHLPVGKLRRGNYVFITWQGDHGPRHVHVYSDRRLVVKWNLEDGVPMKGRPTARVLRLIADLIKEGVL